MMTKAFLWVVVLLCFGRAQADAQGWKTVLQTADSLAQAEKLGPAFDLLREAEADTLSLSGTDLLEWRRGVAAFFHEYDESSERILSEYTRALDLSRKLFTDQPEAYYKDYIDLAFAWYSASPSGPATQWMKLHLPVIEDTYGKNSIFTARFYSVYSLILRKQADYDLSNAYIDQAIQIALQKDNDNFLADFYLNKGLNLYHQGKLEASLEARMKAVEILERQPDKNAFRLARTYCNLGEILEKARQPEKAVVWLDKAVGVYQKVFSPTDGNYYYLWLAYARATFKLKQYDKSEECYHKASAISPESPAPFEGLSRIYLAKGDFEAAHRLMDTSLALFHWHPGMNLEGFDRAVALPFYLDTRTRIFQQQYQQAHQQEFLLRALETASETQRVALFNINKSKKEFNKILPYQEAIGFNKRFLDLAYEQYLITGHFQDLSKAFDIAEMNKSLLLFQSVKSNKGLASCPLPDVLETREWQLRSDITELEKQLYEKNGQNGDTNALFSLKKEYETVKSAIESQCADYFRTAEIFPSGNLSMAMGLTDPGTTLLHYTLTDSALYTFIIRYNEVKVLRNQNIGQLPQLVQEFTQIAREVRPGASYSTRAVAFVRTGTALYDMLVRPAEAQLQGEQVIIIPDSYLNLLPFDLLLRNAAQAPHAYQLHDYWIKTHQISYCYSANLLKEMSEPIAASATETLLALAPFYGESGNNSELSQATETTSRREQFGPLPFSGEEVQRIAHIMGGKALTGQTAGDSLILSQLSRYRFLHFATHARANTQQGTYSFLALGKDKYLYAKDIYNLRLQAELVVLSACESGLGELRDGEGLISLARAFAYSGAKSVLTTLWEVNDESAKEISSHFYEGIRQGHTKSLALALAKRQWLNTHSGSKAHPFYWGGFSLIGSPGRLH